VLAVAFLLSLGLTTFLILEATLNVDVSIWTAFPSLAFLVGASPTPLLSDEALSSSNALFSRKGLLIFLVAFAKTCFLLTVCLIAAAFYFTALFSKTFSSSSSSSIFNSKHIILVPLSAHELNGVAAGMKEHFL